MMAGGKRKYKENRHVHFNEDPVSSVRVFETPPKLNIILKISPASRQSSPTAEAGLDDSPLDTSPTASRSTNLPSVAADSLSDEEASNNEELSNDEDPSSEVWSQEHASDETEGSRASQIQNHFLYSHGDVPNSLGSTKRVLDELLTDFITELCFEAHRAASLAGRQKIKIDDIRFACRKSPAYLGKIQEMQEKKEEIDRARKTLDVNDDKISKSSVKTLEEPPLGDDDDDMELEAAQTARGKNGGR